MNSAERLLVEHVIGRFVKRPEAQLQVLNALWLVAERIVRLLGSVFVSIKITNYLGVSQSGLMNAAMAFAVLFTPLCHLGLDGVLIKYMVKEPDRKLEWLGSGLRLKWLGTTLALVLCMLAAWYFKPGAYLVWAIIAMGIGQYYFMALDVVDIFYQSKTKSKYTVYSKNASFLLFIAIKLVMLHFQAPLLAFVAAQALEFCVASLFNLGFFISQGNSFKGWIATKAAMTQLLKEGWMLSLSSFVILIYIKTDQLMLEAMQGPASVGIFSAALRFSEMWYFVPLAVISSMIPAVIKAHDHSEALFHTKMQRVVDTVVWIGILVGITIQFVGQPIIEFFYKPEFWGAGDILVLHIWAGLFATYGVVGGHYFNINNMTAYNFYRSLLGAIVNVGLNWFLIPVWGGVGAAVATLISQFMAAWGFNLMDKRSWPLLIMLPKALNPFRVLTLLKKV